MKISGIQKLTLLDFPGKVACTIFTPGCNLRCPFCHNASLVFSCTDEIGEESVVMKLTQEETYNFEPGKMAFVQIRVYKSAYEAPGSKCLPVPVWPSLDTRILP